ncbi:YigZ family protein [Spirochaeta dissipatitropha]
MKQFVHVPVSETKIEIERKKSRFIGYMIPVIDRSQVDSRLASLRLEHPDAAHVVYAFCFGGLEREISGVSDDGEPKGTAGRPVYEVLMGHGVTNALLAVVRYFGGTKLGTGGLVKAYGDSAKEVLATAELKELIPEIELSFELPYNLHGGVQVLIEEYRARILSEDFGVEINMRLKIPLQTADACIQALTDLSAGGIRIFRSDQQ